MFLHYFLIPLTTLTTISMPVDKVGRHMLAHRPTYYKQQPSNPIVGINPMSNFFLCKPTTFYYTSVLTIRGSNLQLDAVPEYILEHRQSIYSIPMSGKVISTEIFPEDIEIRLNGETVQPLVGASLKVGDKLTFIKKNKDREDFSAQLVLRCALGSDE